MCSKTDTLWSLVKSVPKRIAELIVKLLSRKGVLLGLTFFLVYNDVLNNWYAVVAWIFISLFVIGGSEAAKWLETLKSLKD